MIRRQYAWEIHAPRRQVTLGDLAGGSRRGCGVRSTLPRPTPCDPRAHDPAQDALPARRPVHDHRARPPSPWRGRGFLAATLRAHQDLTSVYRAEDRPDQGVAFSQAGLTTAALNGLAAETRLDGGSGARQFTDLNLLLAPEDITPARTVLTILDYHSDPAEATTLTCHLDGMLVPRITIDLAQSLHHTRSHEGIREILRRRAWQHCPRLRHVWPQAPTHAVSSRRK